MVLVPIELMSSKIFCREPSPSATTETTEAMPMMMPSMVRKVRVRCASMARVAINAASLKRSKNPNKGLPALRAGVLLDASCCT